MKRRVNNIMDDVTFIKEVDKYITITNEEACKHERIVNAIGVIKDSNMIISKELQNELEEIFKKEQYLANSWYDIFTLLNVTLKKCKLS